MTHRTVVHKGRSSFGLNADHLGQSVDPAESSVFFEPLPVRPDISAVSDRKG